MDVWARRGQESSGFGPLLAYMTLLRDILGTTYAENLVVQRVVRSDSRAPQGPGKLTKISLNSDAALLNLG